MRSLFHFAFHVTDLDAARRFYGGVLGCQEGPKHGHLGGL
jgi:extradiol dioxygenase family protein